MIGAEQVVFEDDDLLVILHQGCSDYLLVTFNEVGRVAGGGWFWGQSLAQRAELTTLGFITKQPSWFPRRSMAAAAATAALAAVLQAHATRILYGHSMGGYAALKYSALLGATITLSFCPQFSIDPAVVAFDSRYHQYFPLNRDRDMAIAAADVAGRAFVFSDPFEPRDRVHVAMIRQRLPAVVAIPVYMTGHGSVRPFADKTAALQLFEACLHGDIGLIKRLARTRRRGSSARSLTLACLAAARHPALARRILAKYHAGSRREQDLFLVHLVGVIGAADEAEQFARLQAEIAWWPRGGPLLYRMSNLLYGRQDFAAALAYAERAVASQPDEAAYHSHLAAMLTKAQRLAEADVAIRHAVSLAPRNVGILCRLSDIEAKQGRIAAAIDTAARAIALAPDNPHPLRHLAGLHALAADWPAAEQALAAAMRVRPDDAAMQQQMADLRRRREQAASAAAMAANAPAALFQGRDIRVAACLFDDDRCFVTFSGWGNNARGFGEQHFRKAGISAIHVMSSWSHWWQTAESDAAIDAVRAALQHRRFARVITYGASMGGYGAALFGGELGADTHIMIAPQFSIDPRKVPFETRWRADAARLDFRRDDMAARISATARKYVVFDPVSPDREHAWRYGAFANVTAIPVPFGGHVPGFLLRDAGMLQPLLRAIEGGQFDRAAFLRDLHLRRRTSKVYWLTLAEVAETRHPRLAIAALGEVIAREPGDAASLSRLSALHQRRGDLPAALEWADKAVQAAPDSAEALSHHCGLLIQVRRLDEAERLMRRALAVRPDLATNLLRMSHICALRKDVARALGWALRAVEAEPGNMRAREFLADIYLAEPDQPRAEAVLTAALQQAPRDVRLLRKAIALRRSTGDLTGALQHATVLRLAAPDDAAVAAECDAVQAALATRLRADPLGGRSAFDFLRESALQRAPAGAPERPRLRQASDRGNPLLRLIDRVRGGGA